MSERWRTWLPVIVSTGALTVSLINLWLTQLKPFGTVAIMAAPVHLTPRLQNAPYHFLYLPLNVENSSAVGGFIQDLVIEVLPPNKSVKHLEALTVQNYPVDLSKGYLSGADIQPQLYLPSRENKTVDVLFRASKPDDLNWYEQGEINYRLKAKLQNQEEYVYIGQFTFTFSKELISAILDCENTGFSILLEDINQARLKSLEVGRNRQSDSFVGVVNGTRPFPQSVEALANR